MLDNLKRDVWNDSLNDCEHKDVKLKFIGTVQCVGINHAKLSNIPKKDVEQFRN